MATEVILDPTRLVIAAILGLVILLVLIIRFKVQAMIAILVGAISIGLIAGMPTSLIVTAVNDGIGNTLKGIALLVGLGSMFVLPKKQISALKLIAAVSATLQTMNL